MFLRLTYISGFLHHMVCKVTSVASQPGELELWSARDPDSLLYHRESRVKQCFRPT